MARTLLTDDIWQQIQDTMRLHGCYCSKNSRNIMEAILWKLRTGATWCDIPQELCPWQTAYNRFNRWASKGLWDKLKSLDIFCDQWNHQYPKIGESWRANWENIRTIFSYPAEIRHAIYTTNAIESLNSVIRHSTKKRKILSSDDSVKKVIYLATSNAAKKWTMPIQNWRLAMNWFTIQFDDRLKDHL